LNGPVGNQPVLYSVLNHGYNTYDFVLGRGVTTLIELNNITKSFDGVEQSLRGTKLAMQGPALWLRNMVRATRLTNNPTLSVHALQGVSFTVKPGEIFGLVGQNGAGKTTLIKIMSGLIRPTSGDGTIANIPLTETKEIRKRVSYVSTSGWMGLEWWLTAEDNIRFFGFLCGMPSQLAKIRTQEALKDVGLWDARDKYPSQLSNGMRQRVIVARALLLRTPVLLLDEPTVGLDPITTQSILNLIRVHLRARGQTIVFTDHQSDEMASVANRIAVLQGGKVAMLGTPAALISQLDHLSVIEVHTEEMDEPTSPPPAIVRSVQKTNRPGALGVCTWRMHVQKNENALGEVLDWIAQPVGRIIFVGESAPTFQDVLMLPSEQEGMS